MALHWIDWTLIAGYVVFALAVGVVYARRAGKDVDEYFLSGRSLPWWIAGTSMVATSFAADTPLVITGWVRDHGIWKNWVWWCYCGGGMLSVFLFARGWRRGGVMTKAELAELRYGGEAAAVLRGILGFMHAGVTNTITLCWVLLAAKKIMEVLLGIDGNLALVLGCAIALVYSLMAGFWGVVVTDLVQFVMAMVGAVALAWLAWAGVGGTDAVLAAAARGAPFTDNTLRFLPETGPGGPFDASFWTIPLAALAVYLGVSWWAAENVDGSGTAVQRIAASKDEREGVLAVMWYNVTHYAMRPWPWILVALASLVALPPLTVTAPAAGEVVSVTEAPADGAPAAIELRVGGGELLRVPLDVRAAGGSRAAPAEEGSFVGHQVVRDDTGVRADRRRRSARRAARLARAKKKIRQVSAKKKAYRASAEGQAGLEHMERVKMLPCAVCGAAAPSDAHHVIHDRYSRRKASDFQTIPLCKAHHQDGPLAIHNGKARWREEYGADWSYLPWVEKMLLSEGPAGGGS
jgi:hypothetical protein